MERHERLKHRFFGCLGCAVTAAELVAQLLVVGTKCTRDLAMHLVQYQIKAHTLLDCRAPAY